MRIFTFSKSEFRGLIVLVSILGAVLIFRIQQRARFEQLEIHVSRFPVQSNKGVRAANNLTGQNKKDLNNPADIPISDLGKSFDPNTASPELLQAYGISHFAVQNIVKYRLKGGTFNTPEDLFSIYGVDSTLVINLLDKIVINDKFKQDLRANFSNPNHARIELNSCAPEKLKEIYGLGPVLSERICNYRNALGGFYSVEQVKEVYGIDSELLEQIKPFLVLDTLEIKKIALNSAEFEELEKHPYISRTEAKAMLSYRSLMGDFNKKQELLDNYLISESSYQRMQKYLEID